MSECKKGCGRDAAPDADFCTDCHLRMQLKATSAALKEKTEECEELKAENEELKRRLR